MFRPLNEAIRESKRKILTKEKLERQLKGVYEELASAEKRQLELEQVLKKELKDFDRIQKTNLISIFYDIIGRREEQIDKEKREYLNALLNFENQEKLLEALYEDRKQIEQALVALREAEDEYQRLLSQKEAFLKQHNHSSYDKLLAIDDSINLNLSYEKDLIEAREAGGKVMGALMKTQTTLSEAETWGTLDMLGGGIMTTALKQGKLGEVQGLIKELKILFSHYKIELNDIGKRIDLDLNIDSLTTFADYFFDNFFTDWVVQSKIGATKQQVQSALEIVRGQLDQMQEQLVTSERERGVLEKERVRLLESQ